jgi:cyanophycinase
MAEVDAEALRGVSRRPPRVAILPTAAGRERRPDSWIEDGVAHFSRLGCEAFGVRVLNRDDAEQPAHVQAVASADLVYLSGGSPGYLVATLRETAVWRAVVAAHERGAVLAGSSAGAMAQGPFTLMTSGHGMPSPETWQWLPGLGTTAVGVIPHYDRLGPERTRGLAEIAPAGLVVYGIDEDTAILARETARVYGRGSVTVWRDGEARVYRPGETIPEPGPIA